MVRKTHMNYQQNFGAPDFRQACLHSLHFKNILSSQETNLSIKANSVPQVISSMNCVLTHATSKQGNLVTGCRWQKDHQMLIFTLSSIRSRLHLVFSLFCLFSFFWEVHRETKKCNEENQGLFMKTSKGSQKDSKLLLEPQCH